MSAAKQPYIATLSTCLFLSYRFSFTTSTEIPTCKANENKRLNRHEPKLLIFSPHDHQITFRRLNVKRNTHLQVLSLVSNMTL